MPGSRFASLFSRVRPQVIAMVHVGPLPGCPKGNKPVQYLVDSALRDSEIYLKHGVDGLLAENMHDIPYVLPEEMGPEVPAVMSLLCSKVRQLAPSNVPCGVQILAGANKEALAVALAAGLQFIRAEGYVFTHVADEGLINASAGPLLRYRKTIGAEHILVFTDIKKKHSAHSITSDVNIVETAQAAEFFLSDGVILTGTSTGKEADADELKELKKNVKLPILIGSGVNTSNLAKYMSADGLIIGSHFKKNAQWSQPVEEERVSAFMNTINALRQKQAQAN